MIRFGLLSLLTVCLLQGCGGGSDRFLKNRPATVPADGVVTYKGQPLAGATIVLSPVGHEHAAAAVTDGSGRFTLSAFPPQRGAVAGNYEVAITAIDVLPMPELPEGVHAEDVKLPPPKSRIPQKYSNPKASGLRLEIPSGGKKDITFDLTD